MKRARATCTLLAVIGIACGTRTSPPTVQRTSGTPLECREQCITPWGQPLGQHDGVVAYSNCSSVCVDSTPAYVKKGTARTYTGIRWQCVEYARRYWVVKRGLAFGSVETAADMWDQIESAQLVQDRPAAPADRSVAVARHENGGTVPPEPDDLLIYRAVSGSSRLVYGHVAVIVRVDLEHGSIAVAEQNYENRTWDRPDDYSRQLVVERKGAGYWVHDVRPGSSVVEAEPNPIVGWMRASHASASPYLGSQHVR